VTEPPCRDRSERAGEVAAANAAEEPASIERPAEEPTIDAVTEKVAKAKTAPAKSPRKKPPRSSRPPPTRRPRRARPLVTEISAAMVKQLNATATSRRNDGPTASVRWFETDGDFDAALKLLREQGMASAAKRAGRETTEGMRARRTPGRLRRNRRGRLRDRTGLQERGLRAFAGAVLDAALRDE